MPNFSNHNNQLTYLWQKFLHSKGLNEEDCSELPLFTDALPIWDALHKFFTSYVDIFYVDDNAIYFDKELAAFWERVDKRGDNGSPWRYGSSYSFFLPQCRS